jgi:4'-phosphopantetheinyl transferase
MLDSSERDTDSEHEAGTVRLVVIRLDTDEETVREMEALLSHGERQRARRFVLGRDRRRFVVGRARLREMLGARLGRRPESIELTYGARGKPAIAPGFPCPDLRFNLSHCGDLAVYAFAYGREVGVDVETVRALRDADRIAARFFSPREFREYLALRPYDRPLGFFNCWTRKEAFIKALGEGLSHPLDRFDVSLSPREPARILRIDSTPGAERDWRMESFSPASGFVAAVVASRATPRSGKPAS